jgi:hypothetical protein
VKRTRSSTRELTTAEDRLVHGRFCNTCRPRPLPRRSRRPPRRAPRGQRRPGRDRGRRIWRGRTRHKKLELQLGFTRAAGGWSFPMLPPPCLLLPMPPCSFLLVVDRCPFNLSLSLSLLSSGTSTPALAPSALPRRTKL